MIYGYCRVSTKKQNILRQVENIIKIYPTAKVFQEAYTGTTTDRKEWSKLKKMVKPGDTIIFDSVSRMSRNAEEGIKEYFNFVERDIELIFLKEGYINTALYKKALENKIDSTGNKIADIYIDATNEVLKILAQEQIKIAFDQAEKEVLDLRERTKEGLRVTKAKGTVLGRKQGDTYTTKKEKEMREKIKKLAKDFGGNLKDIEVFTLLGITKNTYYKYKKNIILEEAQNEK
jgi:DNA invertase Pin-like site-specific DNA recombinase|nr:MAG TPA: gamma delta Resolvase, site specific recombination [Caudoviricetes sp.]